jgi:hypothetical protein
MTQLCPFHWREHPRPSIFALDSKFTAGAKVGKTQGQICAESARKYEDNTGRSLGSIRGLSDRGDRLIEHSEYVRRRRK